MNSAAIRCTPLHLDPVDIFLCRFCDTSNVTAMCETDYKNKKCDTNLKGCPLHNVEPQTPVQREFYLNSA
jgi:hypothetical protein